MGDSSQFHMLAQSIVAFKFFSKRSLIGILAPKGPFKKNRKKKVHKMVSFC